MIIIDTIFFTDFYGKRQSIQIKCLFAGKAKVSDLNNNNNGNKEKELDSGGDCHAMIFFIMPQSCTLIYLLPSPLQTRTMTFSFPRKASRNAAKSLEKNRKITSHRLLKSDEIMQKMIAQKERTRKETEKEERK